ncbi:hypothetical protein CPB83DRAFT_894966 [Crepidotus variabilis]|uniref:DUF1212-domain-containing protein n=1 Tax=Crepidotus variabilis TaxID=179855 RepID=A0A9P6EE36_9AGAR|nr:hypothetical protein CPB83DRAFT_894966 [Crepidotus variabilis]
MSDPQGTPISENSADQPSRPKLLLNESRNSLSQGLQILRTPFSVLQKPRKCSTIVKNLQDVASRQLFILKLAKALLAFGAPSHRIESQLRAASDILEAQAEFVHLPNIIIVSMKGDEGTSNRTYFVRSRGRIALTSLQRVHEVYRDVLHDRMGAEAGTAALRQILKTPPIYSLAWRCFFAFLSASIICGLSFGGSILDMWISGACACVLQYLGLNAANKSSMYANVYEISVSIIVAFVARGLSNIPGDIFCYSSISSAGVVVILPGFTILISALELMSKNIFCGSVRIVYAIIYTLFLGFGLTIGSDFYLVLDRSARRRYYRSSIPQNLNYTQGYFLAQNGTLAGVAVRGVMGIALAGGNVPAHTFKNCIRDPAWPWWRQALPWWTLFFLVPIYSVCSSLSNLQYWRSLQLPIMVAFSCCAYAANRAASLILPGRTDIVSAAGAVVIGMLGNVYSRLIGGTAFTSMVTGVLFLVPSGIAQGGGVTQTYSSSAEQYSSGFSLALRMITVAAGVTIGLFISQFLVYLFGHRKNAGHFAF